MSVAAVRIPTAQPQAHNSSENMHRTSTSTSRLKVSVFVLVRMLMSSENSILYTEFKKVGLLGQVSVREHENDAAS